VRAARQPGPIRARAVTHPVQPPRSIAPPLQARVRELSIPSQLAALLICHLLLWTWAGWSSRSNLDTPGDMVEAYVWGQGWQWGYFKHPPLSAWVAGLWFSVVPEGHFGYALLAALNSAVGLAGLAVLAREFLPQRWVLLVVAVASLTPGLTTLALRFNANAILISTWPWAVAFFVRLMQRGRWPDAVGCGLACALAMLGKYYSGVLLLAMLATAAWLPSWRPRLRSGVFLLALGACVLGLAPHLSWLLAQTEGPLQYAQAATGQEGSASSTLRVLSFVFAQVAFPALAVLIFRLALDGPQRGAAFWQAVLAPLRPRAQATWLLALLPVLATAAATWLTHARTSWVWGLPIAAFMALLMAARARDAGAELSLPRLWRIWAIAWLVVAVAAPLWWLSRARISDPTAAEPRQELAAAIGQAWHAAHSGPLPWVSGTRVLAASVAFYAADHPRYWSFWKSGVETPWVDPAAVRRDGGVIVCASTDTACAALAEPWSADRRLLSVAKSTRGFHFAASTYATYIIAPQSAAHAR
jgi:4-amino-4-deoxy-L-arabinose transferase-like glycosyltransferase